jgi:fructosamine-3-kinase
MMDVRQEIGDLTGHSVLDIAPLGGGCVSAVYEVRLDDGRRLVVKHDEAGAGTLPVEAFMLRTLAERTPLPAPDVYAVNDRLLVMAYAEGVSRFNDEAERHAAELLAALHELTAPTFGFERDTLIGGLRQPNPPTTSWLVFFAEQRLIYMAGEATRAGRLPAATRARVARLAGRLGDWLTEPARPALIHGDVWTTNVLARGGRITAFLDPALYFADAEIELAFIGLFGTFGRAFYEQYHALRPITPGFFEERRDLYNLYPLLVHVRLFGGSYVGQVERMLSAYGC